jgi:hypothetical protein
VGSYELPVSHPQHDADRLGGGMDSWSGRPVVSERLVVWVLAEYGLPAENGATGALMATFLDRLSHELDDALPIHVAFESRPTGKGREHDALGSTEVSGGSAISAPPSLVLGGPIEPGAVKLRTVTQRPSAVHAGPLVRPLHKPLLDAVAEKVGKATDLRFLFVGHEDRSIALAQTSPASDAASRPRGRCFPPRSP